MKKFLINFFTGIFLLGFAALLLSEFFYQLGKGKTAATVKARYFNLSAKLFPLNYEAKFRYSVARLEEVSKETNKELREKELIKIKQQLEGVISKNPLYFNAHRFLAKTLLLLNRLNSSDFSDALVILQRASSIRGKNKELAIDTVKMLLSYWPLLKHYETDYQKFGRDIFQDIEKQLNLIEFKEIIKIWGLYSQDLLFLGDKDLAQPYFNKILADELARLGKFKNQRFGYLEKYENYRLKRAIEDYRLANRTISNPVKLKNRLLEIKQRLLGSVKGYYRFVKTGSLSNKKYLQVKKDLNIQLLKISLDLFKDEDYGKIHRMVLDLLTELEGVREEDNLLNYLLKKNIFKERDLQSFYLKNLINYRLKKNVEVIEEIEKFRGTVSFIKDKEMDQYIILLKLYTDALIDSRLLTEAMAVMKDIEKRAPGQPDVYWRLIRIEQILGKDKELDNIRPHFSDIRKSTNLEINSNKVEKEVFFIDQRQLFLKIGPDLKEKLSNYHLFQVYFNDQLIFEEYPVNLKESFTVAMPEWIQENSGKIKVVSSTIK